jgi:two-component system LytT family response regulator
MEKIRVLVVDDEPPARRRLVDLLERQPDCELAAVGRNGQEGVRLIRSEAPQLVFLDIRMPDLDGFEVVRQVTPEQMPLTIFVTAYEEFAIAAFEAHAFDYLLKPFSDERFEVALQRARDQIRTQLASELSMRLARLIEDTNKEGDGTRWLERIAIKTSGRVIFLDVRQIDWIEAEGVYVNLHVGPKVYLYRATVGHFQERLDPKQFVRVHRSTIVNTNSILELRPRSHGDYSVVLKDQKELIMSRGCRPLLEDWLRQSL